MVSLNLPSIKLLILINILSNELENCCIGKASTDTRCVGKDAMNADGTINRAALPAIFNPEDLNALEQALRLKTHIRVLP